MRWHDEIITQNYLSIKKKEEQYLLYYFEFELEEFSFWFYKFSYMKTFPANSRSLFCNFYLKRRPAIALQGFTTPRFCR